MYIIPFLKIDTMHDTDFNTLKMFADLCLKYFGEDAEYGITGLWQNLENARQYKARIDKLIPLIDTIVYHTT